MEEEEKENPISPKQEQIHSLVFGKEIGWKEIIIDLISTEQLDPWDIDIIVLTDKYLEKIRKLEEADFFLSSKVLLAASMLLRIKSEILLNKYIRSIDEILFGKKEDKKYILERIELEDEIPELIPRSPMPRFKKVTLQELIDSLNKAIVTENRRIRKVIIDKNALRESSISLPKAKMSITDKIKQIFDKITFHFDSNKEKEKVGLIELVGSEKEERCASFYPLLQLENNNKIWLEQEKHFEKIDIWIKERYLKVKGDPYKELRQELLKELGEEFELDKVEMFEQELEDEEKKE
jgi:segregation and condensation protein A